MEKSRGRLTYEQRRQAKGWIFIAPFILGFLLFFLMPVIQSIQYSFHDIKIGEPMQFVGLDNYIFMLNENPTFKTDLLNTFLGLFPQVCIIIFFSLFVSVILNQKFRGRGFARAIFFLPVIITSGVVMELMQSQIFAEAGNPTNVYLFKSTALRDTLIRSGLSASFVGQITQFVNQVFTYTWKSGVQILLFLAGLSAIPRSYYEAASVEGASEWDSFWKITIPLVSPIMFTNIIYTIIDTFTDTSNPVLQSIFSTIKDSQRYGLGAAQSWMFFLIIIVVILIAYVLIGRKTFYMNE
mgnify:CR=1 FL=1